MLVPPPMRSMSTPNTNAPSTVTTPTHGRHRMPRTVRVTAGWRVPDPLEHELRAPPEELLGARPLPHDGRRRPARPLAVGVGPQHPIAVGRLDGARRGRVEGGRLVHIAESMPGATDRDRRVMAWQVNGKAPS